MASGEFFCFHLLRAMICPASTECPLVVYVKHRRKELDYQPLLVCSGMQCTEFD